MKRGKKGISKSKGRAALILHVLMYNSHLKGLLDEWSNERLLSMAHPSERNELKRNL